MNSQNDNFFNYKPINSLNKNLKDGYSIEIFTNLFSIFAFDHLEKNCFSTDHIKLLLADIKNEKFEEEISSAFSDRYLRNRLNLRYVAIKALEWLEQNCIIKEIDAAYNNQNMILMSNKHSDKQAMTGSCSFTTTGLGITESDFPQMVVPFSNDTHTDKFFSMFNSLWKNAKTLNFEDSILHNSLVKIIKEKSPYDIYNKILYNIFYNEINQLPSDNTIKDKTGIKDSVIWNKLYQFQKDGVIGAIDKIERYNGCIIADSVGLGKTFEGLAIIKYYELRNDRVLVLCPKKLRDNWTIFKSNDKRNILCDDRFNYDVLNHTDLNRVRGKSGEIDLKTLNWGNYDLVVIDESHNFRNNPARKTSTITRYQKLMRDIIQAGVKTKVLMLTATPVNNKMNDLKNQIAFIVEGKDDALKEENINSIEYTLKFAQTKFNSWMKLDDEQRTTKSLSELLSFDYFKLLDIFTIARSRKHIQKYYKDSDIGNFPERLKPINIKSDIDDKNEFPNLEEINDDIKSLRLSFYSPLNYVLPHKQKEYSDKYDKTLSNGVVFRQTDREQSLIHLMRVNLFKRMESSINSFTLTLKKLISHIDDILDKIEKINDIEFTDSVSINDIEFENDIVDSFVVGDKIKVLLQDVDCIKWKDDLIDDKFTLEYLINSAENVKTEQDTKLSKLKNILVDKVNNPLNKNNKKVMIFTAFTDTAKYLYENIAEWAKTELNVYTGIITGSSIISSTMPGIRHDMVSILSSFSPLSNERCKTDPHLENEIDFLIATDCISEGQNLQDCDYLINYDIHWNPVRIIQRFGRIDRIGSQNDKIQLVNFWPNMELDEYINLEKRVTSRMTLLSTSATGEEDVMDGSNMNDLEYRRRQLETLQNQVIDIEDLDHNISITNLTLNDFKMDLSKKIKHFDYSSVPMGSYSVAKIPDDFKETIKPGVIFCLEDVENKIASDKNYSLYPYFLTYLSEDGEKFLGYNQAKKILDILKKLSIENIEVDNELNKLFNKQTQNNRNMKKYKEILEKTIEHITGFSEESGVESLFSLGGTALNIEQQCGVNDFEVISYIVLY